MYQSSNGLNTWENNKLGKDAVFILHRPSAGQQNENDAFFAFGGTRFMCGIAGVLQKQARPYPVGQALLTMASCLQHRGMDSAGLAVFGAAAPDGLLRVQVMLPPDARMPAPQAAQAWGGGRLFGLTPTRAGFTACLQPQSEAEDSALVRAIEAALPGSIVSSLGRTMTVEKSVGLADELQRAADGMNGTHGIAHLRLATESRIDPAHAQPFWGRPFADIAVTHNGHITNYHKMRLQFEADGYGFASGNDSEIIGIYLGRKMAGGQSLQQALQEAGRDLDGSFSFIAATANSLGVVRDPFATKPLLYSENDELVALASEPQALHRLLGQSIGIKEIKPKEVRVWETA